MTKGQAFILDSRLDDVDMDIVVFMNLTTDAIEASGKTLEEMLEEQARLLRRLKDPTRQRAIINLDGELPTIPLKTHVGRLRDLLSCMKSK